VNWRLLVRCPGDSSTKSLDFVQDRISCGGPYEQMAAAVVVLNLNPASFDLVS